MSFRDFLAQLLKSPFCFMGWHAWLDEVRVSWNVRPNRICINCHKQDRARDRDLQALQIKRDREEIALQLLKSGQEDRTDGALSLSSSEGALSEVDQ